MPAETEEDPADTVRRLLDTPFWIGTLKTDTYYRRLHDDHDGTRTGVVSVIVNELGDAYIGTQDAKRGSSLLRFRTHGGGGLSLRTRNALMFLAEAIRLDNEESPAGDLNKDPT